MWALSLWVAVTAATSFASDTKGWLVSPALYDCTPRSRSLLRLEYSSTSRSDPSALLGGSGSGSSLLTGPTRIESAVLTDLLVTAVNRAEDRCAVVFEFQRPQVTLQVNGRPSSTQVAELEKSLAIAVIGSLEPNGRIASVTFDPSLGHLARSYAQTLLSLTQFVSGHPAQTTWEVEEHDPSGRYLARYERSDGSYTKRKVRYLMPNAADELTLTTTPEGVFTATLGEDGHIEKIEGEEAQVVAVGTREIARANNRLTLQVKRRERLPRRGLTALRTLAAERERTGKAVPLSARGWEEAAHVARQKKTLGDSTANDLLSELERLEKSADPQAEVTLGRKISALVFLQPAETGQFGKLLLDSPPHSAAMRVIPPALSRAGNRESQEALSAAIRKRGGEPEALYRLVNALAGVDSPTLGSEQAVRQLAFTSEVEEIAHGARLGLATMARNLAKDAPARSDAIVSAIIDASGDDQSEKGARRLLMILGNSGSNRAFPVIRPYVTHQNDEIRVKAIHALRFLTTAEADALVMQTLQTDNSADVRQEAAKILAGRPLTGSSLEVQKRRFEAESSTGVKLTLLHSLGRGVDRLPEVREILERAAASEDSEEIREAARELLTGNSD